MLRYLLFYMAQHFSLSLLKSIYQLLSTALRHDKPQLETRRGELLREEERLRARLQQLQENLLLELAGAQGDVLQNKVNFRMKI